MSKKAEMGVIGALAVYPERIREAELLTSEMFTDKVLGALFKAYDGKEKAFTEAMRIVAADFGEELVTQTIERCMRLPELGLFFRDNVNVVYQDYRTRKLKQILTNVTIGADVDAAVNEILSQLADMRPAETCGKTLAQVTSENEDLYFKPTNTPDLELGIWTLDEAMGGVSKGDVLLIAARPGVGKSAFAQQIIRQLARIGKRVAYFNLEMHERQVYERFLVAESGLRMNRVRLGTSFLHDEESRFRSANDALKGLDNIVIFTGSKRIADIHPLAKGFDVVVVDYLQLVKSDGSRGGNRYAEVGDISRGIKSIATDYNIPVIALSQLNRAAVGKEPGLADLRESGDLEQDASYVLIMWDEDDVKKIKIEKARQGSHAVVDMRFDGEHMTFTEAIADDNPFE